MLKSYKKPIIGVIGRIDADFDNDPIVCIEEAYRIAIIKKGGIPFLLQPPQDIKYHFIRPREAERLKEKEKSYLEQIVDMCDGILIPGGHKWYEYDEYIYEYSRRKNKPILGICLGMQMMTCLDNNREANLLEKNETEINHHQKEENYVHEVTILDNTLLKSIVDCSNLKVNSRHHYHIKKVNQFKVSALSSDGLIEAIEDPNKRFVMGIQWHPEIMIDYDEAASKIFERFIKEAKENSSN